MIDNSKEYILCAVCKRKIPRTTNSYHFNDLDLIEIGYRHHDIRNRFGDEISCSPKDQGFYTSKGRFVSREEAAEIACNCGQIDSCKVSKGYDSEKHCWLYKDLFSEDLY